MASKVLSHLDKGNHWEIIVHLDDSKPANEGWVKTYRFGKYEHEDHAGKHGPDYKGTYVHDEKDQKPITEAEHNANIERELRLFVAADLAAMIAKEKEPAKGHLHGKVL